MVSETRHKFYSTYSWQLFQRSCWWRCLLPAVCRLLQTPRSKQRSNHRNYSRNRALKAHSVASGQAKSIWGTCWPVSVCDCSVCWGELEARRYYRYQRVERKLLTTPRGSRSHLRADGVAEISGSDLGQFPVKNCSFCKLSVPWFTVTDRGKNTD